MLSASTRWLGIRGDALSNLLVTSVSAGALFATQNPGEWISCIGNVESGLWNMRNTIRLFLAEERAEVYLLTRSHHRREPSITIT